MPLLEGVVRRLIVAGKLTLAHPLVSVRSHRSSCNHLRRRITYMKSQETPRSIRQDISTQQIGSETLVYDERRHRAFCLNKSSSVIWGLANGERTIGEMRAAASLQLESPVSEEFVLFAIEELRRDGLIEPAAISQSTATISRRVMMQRIGVGSALLLPAIAAIVAPTAAQAYGGCVDCTPDVSSSRSAQAARARRLQQSSQPASGNAPRQ